jgi:hypothetical protein
MDGFPRYSFSATVSMRVNTGIDYHSGQVGDALTCHFAVDESDPVKIGEAVLRLMKTIEERASAKRAERTRQALLATLTEEELREALDIARERRQGA